MIKILIVEDNPTKQVNIQQTITERNLIPEGNVSIASNIKEARRILKDSHFDLMILDLVLPYEEGSECEEESGAKLLKEIQISPTLKPPIHIVGLTGYSDMLSKFHREFNMQLWNLISYDPSNSAWEDQLYSLISHLVKIRHRFLNAALENKLGVILSDLSNKGLPNTFLGTTWKEICESLNQIVGRIFDVPAKFSNGSKAKNINVDSIKISSEYDFQNLVHLVLRPWLPSLEAENIAIIFDGNTKYADFSIQGNSIVVEAKYIDTTGKKNDTLKTIQGLKDFYKKNANVKAIIFWIVINENVNIDKHKIESEFSQLNIPPFIYIKIFKNNLAI